MKSKPVAECQFLMNMWDFEKNVDLDPSKLSSLSHFRAWWKCRNCGYEWSSQIKNRTISNGSCPKCKKHTNKRVTVSEIPELMKYWGKNSDLDPKELPPYSTEMAHWQCPDCGYEWNVQIFSKMTSTTHCPSCTHAVASPGHNALTEYPDLAKYYDYEYPGNPPLETLLPTSRCLVRWRCKSCGYKWEQRLNERVRRNKGIHRVAECPVCAGKTVAGITANLMTDNPKMLEMWDREKNGNSADGKRYDSTSNYWWKCDKGHQFCMATKDLANAIAGGYEPCPYCDNRRILPGFNSLSALYPDLMDEWDNVSNYALVDPDTVGPGSKEDAWWICPKGHQYRMRISERVLFQKRGRVACNKCKGFNHNKSHIYKYNDNSDE